VSANSPAERRADDDAAGGPCAFHGKVDTKEEAKARRGSLRAFRRRNPDARAYYQKAAREMRERAEMFEARRAGLVEP
jgi:hypothetical protein